MTNEKIGTQENISDSVAFLAWSAPVAHFHEIAIVENTPLFGALGYDGGSGNNVCNS